MRKSQKLRKRGICGKPGAEKKQQNPNHTRRECMEFFKVEISITED